MRILVVEPGRHPKRTEIEHTLRKMQETVGGYIQAIYPWEDRVALVCDEESLFKDSEWNRYICEGVAIKGTFFICGLDEEDFTDLPDELMEKYMKLLYAPQLFIPTLRGMMIINLED